MGFFGFPARRRRRPGNPCSSWNRTRTLCIRWGSARSTWPHNPVAKHPEKWGVTAYKNPEWDLALNYYYTIKNGMSIEEAEPVLSQEFERNHNSGWDLRLYMPRIYLSLHCEVRIAEITRSSVSGRENCGAYTHIGREDVTMSASRLVQIVVRPDQRGSEAVEGSASTFLLNGCPDCSLSCLALSDRRAPRSGTPRRAARYTISRCTIISSAIR